MAHERFPADLLVQPISQRLAYFRSYTVAHPVLQAVDLAVKRALREPAGGSLVLVVGPTGVGKTTLRLRIEQHFRNTFLSAAQEDPGRIPVIVVEAAAPDAGNFSWKDYYRRALLALAEPLIDSKVDYGWADRLATQTGPYAVGRRGDGTELRYALEQTLRHRRPAAVLIDEAQHLTKIASGRKLADQLDCLKSFASLTGCVHVLLGTYELLPVRNLSAQLSRRSLDIHFRRYHARDPDDATAFQRVVYSFQRHLPLEKEPELWRDWDYYYTYSVGCVGILKDWLTRALATALEAGSQTLTRRHLERHAWSLDQCHKMAQDALEGEAALTQTAESSGRLRQLLGLAEPPVSGEPAEATGSHPLPALEAKSPPPQRSRRRAGARRPKRDPIGKASHAG